MHQPTRSRLRTLSLTLTLGALVALYGAGAGYAQSPPEPEACADPPADEVSSSLVTLDDDTTRLEHLALFDVYWDYDDDALDPDSKTLINNPCPPTVVHHPAGFDPATQLPIPARTTRTASDIDIGHTIIHIPSSELQQAAEGETPAVRSFKRRVTADGTGDYDGARYDFLRPEQEDGTRAASADVWVVPACEEDETPTRNDDLDPPFCLGFSAGLLQLNDWAEAPDAAAGEGVTVQYEFEAIREPGHATEAGGWGDFFVFHVENGRPNVIWRTDAADTNVYKITPGTYDHAFWAFTAPGTYVFHVQVKGHPNLVPTVGDPLIEATTVTSVVRRYTFQVGDFSVNHDPIFEVERPVPENAATGTNVGEPVCVKDIDDDTLCFNLHGDDGADENFTIEGSTDTATDCGTLTAVNRPAATGPICAQIQVKGGAPLDYETTASYDLTLQVSDRKDPASNLDGQHTRIDDSIAVTIAVEDENPEPTLTLTAPAAGGVDQSIPLSASWQNAPSGSVNYAWFQRDPLGEGPLLGQVDAASTTASYHFADTVGYRVRARYEDNGVTKDVYSNWVNVRWD